MQGLVTGKSQLSETQKQRELLLNKNYRFFIEAGNDSKM